MELLHHLNSKISLLLKSREQLITELELTKKNNQNLIKKIEILTIKSQELEEKNRILSISQNVSNTADKQVMKKQINIVIQEIDNLIKNLNE